MKHLFIMVLLVGFVNLADAQTCCISKASCTVVTCDAKKASGANDVKPNCNVQPLTASTEQKMPVLKGQALGFQGITSMITMAFTAISKDFTCDPDCCVKKGCDPKTCDLSKCTFEECKK